MTVSNGRDNEQELVFETKRLRIRKALCVQKDLDMLFSLWNNPSVMECVGFPKGLQMDKMSIEREIVEKNNSIYLAVLIVEEKSTNQPIGQCRLDVANDEGLHNIDFKLLPSFWERGYGRELVVAMANYIFSHTSAKGIKGTPSKDNLASQKLFEAVGCKRMGEDVYEFPEHMKHYTNSISFYIYICTKKQWRENLNIK